MHARGSSPALPPLALEWRTQAPPWVPAPPSLLKRQQAACCRKQGTSHAANRKQPAPTHLDLQQLLGQRQLHRLGHRHHLLPMRDSLQVTLSTPLPAAALGVAALKQPVLPAKLQRPAARSLNIVALLSTLAPVLEQVLALARRLRVLLGVCWVSFFRFSSCSTRRCSAWCASSSSSHPATCERRTQRACLRQAC